MTKTRTLKVFISSTFIDMQEERNYLNLHIFPVLRQKCAKRGVSFYAVDLRWGVTEEETRLNRTIDICLQQVEESIPCFIGLIGNRYGWVPDDKSFIEKYPWVSEKKPMSATEMEIRHYLRTACEEKNCSFFAVKSPELCNPMYDDGNSEEIKKLISLITYETGKEPFCYSSIESLGEEVLSKVSALLDERFPESECTLSHEVDTYIKGFENYDISNEFDALEKINMADGGNRLAFAHRDTSAFDVTENALLRFRQIILTEPFGCENLCNRYLYHALNNIGYSIPESEKLCIMCDSSEKLQNPIGILEQVHTFLKAHVTDPSKYSAPYTTGITKLRTLISHIINMKKDLISGKEIFICISNLHLLSKFSPWYNLPFLMCLAGPEIRLILTTADENQGALLSKAGFTNRKFPISFPGAEKAGFFASFIRSLELEGKHLERDFSVKLLSLNIIDNTEKALFLSNYLKNFVIFDDLKETLARIIELVGNGENLFSAVLSMRLETLSEDSRFSSDEKKEIIKICASLLDFVSLFSLNENTVYRLFTESGSTPKTLYLTAFEMIRPFIKVHGKGLSLFNSECAADKLPALSSSEILSVSEITNLILNDKADTWDYMEDNYSLIHYLERKLRLEELVKLVGNNNWLEYVSNTDFHLLRCAWRALEKHSMLDIKKIYESSGHLNDGSLGASRQIYDMLMKMEHSVTGGEIIECYLDIPYSYSLDCELSFRKSWSFKDSDAVTTLKEQKDSYSSDFLRSYPDSCAAEEPIDLYAMSSIHEIICHALSKRNELSEKDITVYLYYACLSGCLRQIADAVSLFSEKIAPSLALLT